LTDIDCLELKQLLESHLMITRQVSKAINALYGGNVGTYSVVTVFTCSDFNTLGCQRLSDRSVSNIVIRGSGFLNEPRVEGFKLFHVFDCLRYVPDLYKKGVASE
jgi:hypothetical protein